MRTEKRRRSPHKWTPEEDAQILQYASEDLNYHKMSPLMDIPAHIIAARGAKLGLSMAKHRGGSGKEDEPLPKEAPALKAIGRLIHADGTRVEYTDSPTAVRIAQIEAQRAHRPFTGALL